jgi:hypothetical protein
MNHGFNHLIERDSTINSLEDKMLKTMKDIAGEDPIPSSYSYNKIKNISVEDAIKELISFRNKK